MRIDLTGKTALVTGSTEGIGFGIAQGLARAGATVIVNGRTQAKVDKAVEKIGGKVEVIHFVPAAEKAAAKKGVKYKERAAHKASFKA